MRRGKIADLNSMVTCAVWSETGIVVLSQKYSFCIVLFVHRAGYVWQFGFVDFPRDRCGF